MSDELLQTKLFIPPLRPDLVRRPRLIERMNLGLRRKLTLISAPAGFGKTTLVSEWVSVLRLADTRENQAINKVTWLSLDQADNDQTQFLLYFIAALDQVDGKVATFGQGALAMLQSSLQPPAESILTTLLNDITNIPYEIILVLDDYHMIDSQPVDQTLSFLLDHLPPQMHLVIATREDPNLPLARLRVSGQLTELRITDLRFTPTEAAGFLNQVMGLNLSAEEIAALDIRTEGWIAGLQMAALSMQGRSDTGTFIQAFTGSHHFVLDYLVEEVLQRQPDHIRKFLLQTSILNQLSGPICDAVRFSPDRSEGEDSSLKRPNNGEEDGRAILEALEHANLFVVPLDDARQFYRYHHLFADVLQAHLLEEQPNQLPALHRRASEWYEQHGQLSDSIRHALIAQDFERAAGLVELAWPTMDETVQFATWLGWVKALPDNLIHVRPVLTVNYAWALLNSGQLEAAEVRLRDAEHCLDQMTGESERPVLASSEMVVVDFEQFRTLPASLATARAFHAQALGDRASTINYTQKALELLPADEYLRRGQAMTLQGLAYWASGNLEAAHQSFIDFMAISRIAGNVSETISATFVLAEIKVTLGRLHEASKIIQHDLSLVEGQGEPRPPGTEDMYRGLSDILREWGDLEAAEKQLLRGSTLGEQFDLPDWQHRLRVTQARLKLSQGNLDDALDLLDEAEQLYIRTPLPYVRPLAAMKARIWISQGRLAEAWRWVRERDLSHNDDLKYLREFEHVTLARLLIAQYAGDQVEHSYFKAKRLLGRLLQAAEESGRMGTVIEILVLQAIADHAQGQTLSASLSLKRALTLAEPEGYIRLFVDEGPSMAAMLRKVTKQGATAGYARRLLANFGKAESKRSITQPLIEPLSERELEVLSLLATELSGPEISRELMISLNTMRSHTKSIYSKLGVNNRRSAVRCAEELGLI